MQVIYNVFILNSCIIIFGSDVVVVICLLQVLKCKIIIVQFQQINFVSSRLIIKVRGKLCFGFLNFEVRWVNVFRSIKYQNIIDNVVNNSVSLIFFGVGKGIFVGLILFVYQIVIISATISSVITVCRFVLELVLRVSIYYINVSVSSFVNNSCQLCQLNIVWLNLVVICSVVGKFTGMIDKNNQSVICLSCELKVISTKCVILFVLGQW